MRVSERQLFVVVVGVGDHGDDWWRARGEFTVNPNRIPRFSRIVEIVEMAGGSLTATTAHFAIACEGGPS